MRNDKITIKFKESYHLRGLKARIAAGGFQTADMDTTAWLEF